MKYVLIHLDFDSCYYEGDCPDIKLTYSENLAFLRQKERQSRSLRSMILDQNFVEHDIYE